MVNIYKGPTDRDELTKYYTAQEQIEPRKAGFVERFGTQRQRTFTVGTGVGRQAQYEDIANQQLQILKDNNLDSNFQQSTLPILLTPEKTLTGDFYNLSTDALESIKQQREIYDRIASTRPDLGLKTIQQLEEATQEQFEKIISDNNKTSSSSTLMGTLGMLAGGMAGFFQDPFGAATLAVPGGAGVKAMSIMQAIKSGAKAEAIAAAAPLALNKPGELGVRRKAGEEISTGQAVLETGLEVGLAALGGGILGGAVKAISSKGTKALVEDLEHIETHQPTNISKEEHLNNVEQSLKDIQEGKPLSIERTEEASPSQDVDVSARPEDVATQRIEEARTILDELDDEELKLEFNTAERESTSFQDVVSCLLKGGIESAD